MITEFVIVSKYFKISIKVKENTDFENLAYYLYYINNILMAMYRYQARCDLINFFPIDGIFNVENDGKIRI